MNIQLQTMQIRCLHCRLLVAKTGGLGAAAGDVGQNRVFLGRDSNGAAVCDTNLNLEPKLSEPRNVRNARPGAAAGVVKQNKALLKPELE